MHCWYMVGGTRLPIRTALNGTHSHTHTHTHIDTHPFGPLIRTVSEMLLGL